MIVQLYFNDALYSSTEIHATAVGQSWNFTCPGGRLSLECTSYDSVPGSTEYRGTIVDVGTTIHYDESQTRSVEYSRETGAVTNDRGWTSASVEGTGAYAPFETNDLWYGVDYYEDLDRVEISFKAVVRFMSSSTGMLVHDPATGKLVFNPQSGKLVHD